MRLKANQFIRELTTPLKIKIWLVVKNTHAELLLFEGFQTEAMFYVPRLDCKTHIK